MIDLCVVWVVFVCVVVDVGGEGGGATIRASELSSAYSSVERWIVFSDLYVSKCIMEMC